MNARLKEALARELRRLERDVLFGDIEGNELDRYIFFGTGEEDYGLHIIVSQRLAW